MRQLAFIISPASRCLDGAPPLLGIEALFARGGAWFRRPSLFGPPGGVLQQRHEARARRFAILRLRAVFAAVDEEDTVAREAMAGERAEALLHVGGPR